jgi:hypothetical protein
MLCETPPEKNRTLPDFALTVSLTDIVNNYWERGEERGEERG